MIDSIRVESDELSLGLIEREVRGMGLCAAYAAPSGYLLWDPSGKRSDISTEKALEFLGVLSERAKGKLEAVEVFVSSDYLKQAKGALKAGGYAASFDTKYY